MHHPDLQVLGPVTATRDGAEIPLGGRRQRMVLAALLVARGRVLPADRLRDLVWGDGDRTASRATLHGYVAGLRKALEPGRPARGGHMLVREGPGYLLRLPPERVDAERFTRAVARGAAELDDGCPAQAVATLEAGLAQWRGPAFAGLGTASFALPEVARLDALRAAAAELRLAALLELGRHAAVIGELEALVIEQPLRERGWELLAVALYRAGRQGDALAVVRRARAELAAQLGVDPGPALRRLETAILAHADDLQPATTRPGAAIATTPVTAQGAQPAAGPAGAGNVPAATSSFVGRRRELRAAGALVAAHRLVTLTGPPGVGKSRLATELARRRPDPGGSWLVDLAGLRDPARVTDAVAGVLGVPAGTVDGLAATLAGRAALLVLDNAELLLPGVVAVVDALLSRCPGVRVLVTSREALDLPSECVVTVPPLPLPEAVTLLSHRVAAVSRLTVADLALAERVCADLDRLPLAIELAAAQCRALSLAEVADRLHDRFALLRAGGHRPERHRTLSAAIAWSYRTLTDGERRLLHRLSALTGAFDLAGAHRLAGSDAAGSIVPDLVGLVRKSLVMVDPSSSPRRFGLLRTVRAYAHRRPA
ncbi:BTAD domain-containing putative transcriptional regulator [Dactylosporangium sp. AC04546]|uniref:BTAD domain-containing putative transcriptional regulator n=1 Tax=Dactylosporangium sp. AC04546 TaxID=2862460 RepID=UPI001EE0F2D2|nr:BTAD domain-containing putative transcriptional regulator [Dactylosporangium sp. AC04546]WVK78561.1 BTAD domain-containing putative transcriptional regulator [Dactylosporangium sp. AC04546]